MKNKGRPALLKGEKESGRLWSVIAAVLAFAVIAVVLTGIWFRSNFVAYNIVGSSMRNTLFDGDWVYARQGASAERGDIVIVDVRDRAVFGGDEAIIKRLIAVEGDTVSCSGGVVYLRKQGGEAEPLDESYTRGVTGDFPEVTVKAGEVFVAGDNRKGNESFDSRDPRVGTFPVSKIVAVVPQWAIDGKTAIETWETFRSDVRKFLYNLFHGE